MNQSDILEKQKYIFTKLFLLSNNLQLTGDQILKGEMTIRQWLTCAAIAQFGNSPPTLSETARMIGTSRQNVKQMALNLQKRGFLILQKDLEDKRAIRLVLTQKSCIFWESRQREMEQFLFVLFGELKKDAVDSLHESLNKLYDSIKT